MRGLSEQAKTGTPHNSLSAGFGFHPDLQGRLLLFPINNFSAGFLMKPWMAKTWTGIAATLGYGE